MKRRNRILQSSGFSVIESVIAVTIVGISVAAIYYFMGNAFSRYAKTSGSSAVLFAEDDIRVGVMKQMKRFLSQGCNARSFGASFDTDSGIRFTLLSAQESSALVHTNPDPSVQQACSSAGRQNRCGTTPPLTPMVFLSDAAPANLVNHDAFCFCAKLSAHTLNANTAKLDQLTKLGPVYGWFRYRARNVRNDPFLTCNQLPPAANGDEIVNQLDYSIFWGAKVSGQLSYQKQDGSYTIGIFP